MKLLFLSIYLVKYNIKIILLFIADYNFAYIYIYIILHKEKKTLFKNFRLFNNFIKCKK